MRWARVTLAQRVRNLVSDFSQSAEVLGPADTVMDVSQITTTSPHLDVIVRRPASGKWEDMNSHYHSANFVVLLSFPQPPPSRH